MKKENKKTARIEKEAAKKKALVKDRIKLGLLIGIPVIIFAAIIVSTFVDFKALFNGTANTAKFFSKYLTDEGKIAEGPVSDYVEIEDYSAFCVDYGEIEAGTDEITAKIQAELVGVQTLSEDTELVIENGNKVNIDYIGKTGDKFFENTLGAGTDLTVGSGTYIPGFEEQLIGHKVGEQFDITVTFPDDYKNNPDLSGKEAVFTTTVNGIYVDAELTDEIVREKFSDVAENAEEYREYVKSEIEKEKLALYVDEYIRNNGSVKKYPDGYMKHMEKLTDFLYESQYDYFDENLSAYGSYKNKYDYFGWTKDEYYENVNKRAAEDAEYYLKCQAIFEQLGLTISENEIVAFWKSQGTDTDYNGLVEIYGKGYATRVAVCGKVIDTLAANAELNK